MVNLILGYKLFKWFKKLFNTFKQCGHNYNIHVSKPTFGQSFTTNFVSYIKYITCQTLSHYKYGCLNNCVCFSAKIPIISTKVLTTPLLSYRMPKSKQKVARISFVLNIFALESNNCVQCFINYFYLQLAPHFHFYPSNLHTDYETDKQAFGPCVWCVFVIPFMSSTVPTKIA